MSAGGDRRKAKRLTISQILDRMQREADTNYQGDLPNNVSAIFSKLSVDDRKTFLRRSLELHWSNQIELAKNGMQDIVIEPDAVIDPVSVEKEKKSIEDMEVEEQIKLKMWMSKVSFSVGMVVLITIILVTYFYGPTSSNVDDLLKRLNTVADFLFK